MRRGAEAIVEACRTGATLCKHLHKKPNGETELHFFLTTGKLCSAAAATEAIKSGLLVPSGDGLLDETTSQTWRVK